jgi:hypothetical protein
LKVEGRAKARPFLRRAAAARRIFATVAKICGYVFVVRLRRKNEPLCSEKYDGNAVGREPPMAGDW